MFDFDDGQSDRERELNALRSLLIYATETAEGIGADKLAEAIKNASEVASRETPPGPDLNVRIH